MYFKGQASIIGHPSQNTFFVNNPLNNVEINYNVFKIKEQRKKADIIKEEEEEAEELYKEKDYYTVIDETGSGLFG